MRVSVTYLTHYTGDKLPPWYIGSSFEDRVITGYNGTITSRKWKLLYQEEQKYNKHLFKTRILSYHLTKEDAIAEEARLQRMHNVVKSVKYFNESVANVNGMYGRDVSGMYNPNYGKVASQSTKYKQSLAATNRAVIVCPHCGTTSTTTNLMTRWHFDNCKSLNSTCNLYNCKYCNKTGRNKNNMDKYHNENCKLKPNTVVNILICEHCGFQSNSMMNMTRWHFENCKHNKNKKVNDE